MAKARTRLIRFFLRKIGYDLRRLQRTTILDFDNEIGRGLDRGFEAFDATMSRPVPYFDIVFRCCARAEMDSPNRRRFFDSSKRELVRCCLASLVASANEAAQRHPETKITLTVVDNHSDAPAAAEFRKELAHAKFSATLINPAPEFLDNGPSMRASYVHGREHGRDVVYFVEDDYLHAPGAVEEIIQGFGRLSAVYGRDVILSPFDNPHDYRRVRSTHVLLGGDRHWRRTWMTTFTSVTTLETLRKYWKYYDRLGDYGVEPDISEHNTINLIYAEVPCLSPMPSLAVHMQMLEHVSPYVDWRGWWARYSDAPLRPLARP